MLVAQLDALLDESVAHAAAREASAFDDVARESRGLVLMGAGGLGRRVLAGLVRAGQPPIAMADNNPRSHGTTIDGISVLSPADAAALHGEHATFVVTIWGANSPHRFEHTRAQLQAMGVKRIVPFSALMWKHAGELLPFYCQDLPHRALEQATHIRAAFALWADDDSRAEFLAQLRFRLLADFDGMSHPVKHPQYFPNDLFDYGPSECFVDCGAYDGDTIAILMAHHGDAVSRVIALEPDPLNVATLERFASTVTLSGGLEILPLAASAARGRTWIETTGTASSALTGVATANATAIECATLDELLAGEPVTFIKMDIEGAEPEALIGARETIRRTRPVLAICVYHRQDHLWRLPLMMRDTCSDYTFHLRPHNEEGWDLVCYGVPNERLRAAREER